MKHILICALLLFGLLRACADESTAVLTLNSAIEMAMTRNPGLAVLAHGARSAEALARQAGVRPNPSLELELGEYNRDGQGFESAEVAVALGQSFELGGKRRARARAARSQAVLVDWDLASRRLDVEALTIQRFVSVLVAQQRVELADSSVELSRKRREMVSERVKAGKEPPFRVSKADAELETARLGRIDAESELAVARHVLVSTWCEEAPRFERAEGALEVPSSIPAVDTLRLRLPANPDLARWDDELGRREADLSFEKRQRIPDLTASVAYHQYREDDSEAMSFGVGLDLPLFGRNQGNVTAAQHELAKARLGREAAAVAQSVALAASYAQLASAHGRALVLRDKVVPAIRQASDAAGEGYRQGKFNFLDLLDAQTGLVEAQSALLDALSDYYAAATQIQRIVGSEIEGLIVIEKESGK